MADSAAVPVSGLVAGKYEVVRLIGRGGMGSVWEGRHASLGTRVAIKFIDPEYADSREAQTRFVNEARAAATIQSKHAIQIFDHGVTDDGRPYIVMEMLVGEPLDKRLERTGRISLQETARILGQVCRALQRAHDAGIIHRDLKPENVFLVRSPDDDDEIAKVLDFGIAKMKAAPGEKGMTSSTKTGAVLGTPYYMSPEQARGLRNIDHRTDLWSLGVIAYKCITGILPFEGESVGDLLVKICTAPPPVPSMTLPGIPVSFDAWFARTMEREPPRRFGTAQELSEGLAFAAGVSVRRGPTSSQPDGAVSSTFPAPPTPIVPYAATVQGVPGSGVVPSVQVITPHPGVGGAPIASAGVTSAPFVGDPASIPKSRSGVLLAVIAAALVGGAVGVFAIVKLVSPPKPPEGHAVTVTASAISVVGPGASISLPSDPPPPPVVSLSSLPTAQPTVPRWGPGVKPPPGKPGAPPATTPSAAPPPPPPPPATTSAAPPKPPPSKPQNNSSDPGY